MAGIGRNLPGEPGTVRVIKTHKTKGKTVNDKNGAGKMFNAAHRFELTIKVFGPADDVAAKAIRRMASGTVIVYPTLEAAIATQTEFLDEAGFVAGAGRLAVYGFTIITDTRDGCLHNPEPIQYRQKSYNSEAFARS